MNKALNRLKKWPTGDLPIEKLRGIGLLHSDGDEHGVVGYTVVDSMLTAT